MRIMGARSGKAERGADLRSELEMFDVAYFQCFLEMDGSI
jgi:hypothetical protein